MKILRYRFNMVEVMLAIVVITLGLATVFTLFPVGLNANQNAIADNSIADIAEYLISHVRAKCKTDSVENGVNGEPFKSAPDFFCGKDANLMEDAFADIESPAGFSNAIDGLSGDDAKFSMLFKHDTVNGVYLIRQISGEGENRYADFAAVARVYLDETSGDLYKGFKDANFSAFDSAKTDGEVFPAYEKVKNSYNKINIGKYLLPVVLELSWPATSAREDREIRYFRFEIFNDKYKFLKDADFSSGSGS